MEMGASVKLALCYLCPLLFNDGATLPCLLSQTLHF
jgi:hypothetical protein